MKSMETGRQDGGSDKNHAPFSVGKTGNISRKFLTIILKIFDKNFERLQFAPDIAIKNEGYEVLNKYVLKLFEEIAEKGVKAKLTVRIMRV